MWISWGLFRPSRRLKDLWSIWSWKRQKNDVWNSSNVYPRFSSIWLLETLINIRISQQIVSVLQLLLLHIFIGDFTGLGWTLWIVWWRCPLFSTISGQVTKTNRWITRIIWVTIDFLLIFCVLRKPRIIFAQFCPKLNRAINRRGEFLDWFYIKYEFMYTILYRLHRDFVILLQNSPQVTPGRPIEDAKIFFIGKDCYEALSEPEAQIIYDQYQVT